MPQRAALDVLAGKSALQLARAIRERALSCEEVTAAFLARTAQRNPELGALVQVWPERALGRAQALDRALGRGAAVSGIFYGVPTAIKDVDPSRGAFNRMGSRMLRHLWSPVDGPVATRVRKGGFNVIGRSATSEFALLPVVETDVHPPCRTPGAPESTPGGSRGGAAAAVGGGMLPIAHASDAAGSIRIPASLCGLVGLKPSRGLLPNFYRPVDPIGLCAVQCVATDVLDSAAFLDVLLGRQYAPEQAPHGSLLAATASQAAARRLAIRYCTGSPGTQVAPEVQAAVQRAATLLRELHHDVEEAVPLAAGLDEFLPIWQRMAANMPLPVGAPMQVTTRYLRQAGERVSRQDAARIAQTLSARVLAWFGDADLWLTPTVGPVPPRIGEHRRVAASGEAQFRFLAPLAAFTAPFNLTGQPALTLPMGRFESGVGIGVQLVMRQGHDAELLALARMLEAARGPV